MSLFIGTLAFGDDEHGSAVRLGVLAGSLASATLGYVVLRAAGARAARANDSMAPTSSEGGC
jgi:NhaA family Na+:H+ antiporter